MSENNVVEVLRGVVGELKEIARSETVVGEAITVGEKTVIPVMKISFGFGAGGGQGEAGKAGGGFGGGGGGGARVEPAAFIIMDKDGINLLPAQKGKWDQIIEAIPAVAKKISKLAEKFKSDDKGLTDEEFDELFGTDGDSDEADDEP
jgi:uncharacterized spore protein YtfJ